MRYLYSKGDMCMGIVEFILLTHVFPASIVFIWQPRFHNLRLWMDLSLLMLNCILVHWGRHMLLLWNVLLFPPGTWENDLCKRRMHPHFFGHIIWGQQFRDYHIARWTTLWAALRAKRRTIMLREDLVINHDSRGGTSSRDDVLSYWYTAWWRACIRRYIH